jgi:STELLO glycosyltransferases
MKNKFIVITSINYPSEAVLKFSQLEDWQVIVVADLKTPEDWQQDNVTILTVEKQLSLPFETAKKLPWNHYARKNLGYLYAIMQGAEILYETDDDNIPYEFWPSFYPIDLEAEVSLDKNKFVNAYSYFCQENVWPRGFPLEFIQQSKVTETTTQKVTAPIQQGLANLDPDVDAIYRLVQGQEIVFNQRPPLFINSGTYCPFNSQNTLWYPSAFQYLFLPAYVPNRVTDIWRGYIVQRFLHIQKQGILFCNASVFQHRNFHNLMHDFKEELDIYTKTQTLVQLLDKYTGDYKDAIKYLSSYNFFNEQDIVLFDAWLKDIHSLQAEI